MGAVYDNLTKNRVPEGGRKNYLINGNFDSWQYGTSQSISGYGSDDRWDNTSVGSTKTHSMVNATDTERALFSASKFSRTVVTSIVEAASAVLKKQRIENVTKLAGKTVTLSFWAKADTTKNIAIEFAQAFGSGGSPSAIVNSIAPQLIALTNTWQKKTITVTLPSIIGKTLGTDGVHTSSTIINFWFDAGSNFTINSASLGQQSGTFDIAEVKIEDGSVATDGWHPYDGEFGGELQACQRYYEKIGAGSFGFQVEGYSGAGTITGAMLSFVTPKRVVPTITVVGTWVVSNCAQPTIGAVSTLYFEHRTTVTALGSFNYRTSSSSTYINVLAEL